MGPKRIRDEGHAGDGGGEARPGPGGRIPEAAVPAPPWALPERRKRRGTRPQLDRDQVVAAALAIIDAEGVDALSLRRLADDLRVTPMSLYWHVRDKAQLLELVGHAVLAEIEVPPSVGDWRDQIRDIHRNMLAGFLRHPNTGEILVGRARYGPGGLVLFERILAILLGAGFSPQAAFDAYQALYLFTLGAMATSGRTPEFRAAQQQGLLYMRSLPVERFPSIRSVVTVIGRRSLEEQFEIGLDVQIEGIAARLAPSATG
jgi:AcrR family transcriptional regulator